MDIRIIETLSAVTEEEQEILRGRKTIDRRRYMYKELDVVSGEKLLEPGKLIAVRPHTRFIHFPEHTHDFVEMVYMCRGQTEHIINDSRITLREGELLLLGQHTRQQILPAEEGDIAVNFIIRPEFFGGTLNFFGSEDTPLREFIVQALRGDNPCEYFHFQVASVKSVQNLVENLLWALISDVPNRRSINQLTMGLLFVQLLNHTDKLSLRTKEQKTVMEVLRYIEENYAKGTLSDVAELLHYDPAWLSREIKRRTGKTYTELVQEKRLSQAAWLLSNTRQRVDEIALSVGYENISYFHRIFAARFHKSPKAYRDCK